MLTVVLDRLRSGSIETQSPFDRRSFPTYIALGVVAVAGAILLVATGFSIDPVVWLAFPLWCIGLLMSGMLLRRYGHSRMGGFVETTGLVYGQGMTMLVVLFPVTALSLPFADDWLAAADRAIGFNWPAYALFIGHYPKLVYALLLAYNSFTWQPLLLMIFLFATGRDDRAWHITLAGMIALLVTAVLYPFAPAVGTFNHFGITPADYPAIKNNAPWNFAPTLHLIKEEGVRRVTPALMAGLVSFPSYHAAAAAIFTWSARRTRLFWPGLLLNICLGAAALIFGAHYLVDLIAGVAVGGVSIWGADRILRAGLVQNGSD